ncbi:MAG: hypothetical protein PHC62_00880 [Candidatus Izemoplasmatales bacterium]|nr:hypothetical protein [Candidatus Izemoplasmatales bacterium]
MKEQFNLKGQLVAVFDEQMALHALKNDCKVIYVGDMTGVPNPGYIGGTPLIPKVEAMQTLIAGSTEEFQRKYMDQLYQDPFVLDYIETVVCALYSGVTVVLYIPKDAQGFGFHHMLFDMMAHAFGLNIQAGPNIPFTFNPYFIPQILEVLIKRKQITPQWYLYHLPMEFIMDPSMMWNIVLPLMGYEINQKNADYVLDWKRQMEDRQKVLRPLIRFE